MQVLCNTTFKLTSLQLKLKEGIKGFSINYIFLLLKFMYMPETCHYCLSYSMLKLKVQIPFSTNKFCDMENQDYYITLATASHRM
jgi:hypothetical protein